jgi:hypothetical protein
MPYWAKGGPPKMPGFVTNATSEDVFSRPRKGAGGRQLALAERREEDAL